MLVLDSPTHSHTAVAETTLPRNGPRSRWRLALAAVLAVGLLLRLVWPGVLEYKEDEAWMFDLVRRHVTEGHVSWLGMPSSQGPRIAGLSVWMFYPMGWLFGVDSPEGLGRGVAVLSVMSLLMLVWLARRWVAPAERDAWLGAVALLCVNPFMVIYQRKIWPPCTMAILQSSMLLCWWNRAHGWGAFGWGLFSVVCGQIHVAGFFFAAVLWLWTILARRGPVAWRYWFAGSCVGAVPMIPWLHYLTTFSETVRPNSWTWTRLFEMKYWTHWIGEPLGLTVQYHLGSAFRDFLAGPVVFGIPTYGIAVLHAIAIILGGSILTTAAVRTVRGWRDTPPFFDWLFGRRSDTALVVHAALFGYGVALLATRLAFQRHYLLITYPLSFVWLATLAIPPGAAEAIRARGRMLIAALCVTLVLISGSLLDFLHRNGGSPYGFGTSYEEQVRHGSVLTHAE
jgi:hypothetical protein